MNDKLQELTERLYEEGVRKAQKEAETIHLDAEKSREEIIKNAEREAAIIIEKGMKKASDLRLKTESELAMAARQAESSLKQRIVNLFANNVLSTGVEEALNNENLLGDLIISTMSSWVSDGKIPDISLVLSDRKNDVFYQKLKSSLKKQIAEDVSMDFSGRIKNGFRIDLKDGSCSMSFTDKDFEEFFRSFLKEKTRSALFGEN